MPAARRQGERERERERKREKKRKGGRQGGRDHSRQRQAMMQTWSADVAHIGGHIVWGDDSHAGTSFTPSRGAPRCYVCDCGREHVQPSKPWRGGRDALGPTALFAQLLASLVAAVGPASLPNLLVCLHGRSPPRHAFISGSGRHPRHRRDGIQSARPRAAPAALRATAAHSSASGDVPRRRRHDRQSASRLANGAP